MHGTAFAAMLLAKISKHDIGGIVGVIVGLAFLAFAAMRFTAKLAGTAVFAAVGGVALLVGILLFSRAI